MRSREFWLDALERSIKTTAQMALVNIPTAAAVLAGGVDWRFLGITIALAPVASLLTSIVGSKVGNPESASMLPEKSEP